MIPDDDFDRLFKKITGRAITGLFIGGFALLAALGFGMWALYSVVAWVITK